MGTVTTNDGVEIFYKDWGAKDAQVLFFHHGWPLSSDDWDAQLMFFLNKGFRVVAHDRRGHGRSSQVTDGHDMDHYADDVSAVVAHLAIKDAIHIGHSTGGGEVVRYITRHGQDNVKKAVLISAVTPFLLKTPDNLKGLPKSTFDEFQQKLAQSRSEFFHEVPAGPFYNFNRFSLSNIIGKASEPVIQNWWRQGMMGGTKAQYDGIIAFSQTDFREEMKAITIPVLVMHGEDDQVVPFESSGELSVQLLPNSQLKSYPDYPHGMPTTHADVINEDLLAFINS